MRSVTLDLDVLIRDPVNDNPWPGTTETITFDDAACPAGSGEDPTEFLVEQGFVVLDYDPSASDSIPAPIGWQYYPQADAVALIPLWAAAGAEWHAATKITCSNDPDNFWVVSDSYYDVLNAFNVCCGAANIPSQAFSLKQSNYPLTPDVVYPCGAEAIFKWLGIYGTTEERPNLTLHFFVELRNEPNDFVLSMTEIYSAPFTATYQLVKSWPADFVGMVINGITLVDNDTIPGAGQMQVREFDNGTVTVRVYILDQDDNVILNSFEVFALPGTDCDASVAGPEIFEEIFSPIFS